MARLELEAKIGVGAGERVWHVAWAPGGRHLASCGEDKVLRVWQLEATAQGHGPASLRCLATLEDAQTRTLRSCEWSPDGRLLACASFDGTVVVWEALSGGNLSRWEQVATLEGHENEVKSVAWSPDGRWLATCGRDKKVWVWERLSHQGNEFECVSMLQGHTQDVKFIKWHPTESGVLFSASYDDSIKVWVSDDEGGGGDEFYCTATLTGHASTVWGLAINPESGGKEEEEEMGGRRSGSMVSCSADFCLILWHCDGPMRAGGSAAAGARGTWRAMHSLKGVHSAFPIYTLDWCPDSGLLLSGGGDNSIALCRVVRGEGGSETIELVSAGPHCVSSNTHKGDVNCVRWRQTSDQAGAAALLAASASDDGTIGLWRAVYV